MQSTDGARVDASSAWNQDNSSWMTDAAHGQEDASTKKDLGDHGNTLDAIVNRSVHALDVPVRPSTFHEDELFSWLQFPIEESADRVHSSDVFAYLPNSDIHIARDSLKQLGIKPQDASFLPPGFRSILHPPAVIPSLAIQNMGATGPCSSNSCDPTNRVAGADAAMAVGVAWAAGLSPSGSEVLSKLPAAMQSPPVECSPKNSNSKSSELNFVVSQEQNRRTSYTNLPFPTAKPLETATFFTPPSPPVNPGTRNFSHFSRPVAEAKASLNVVGGASGPTNIERVRQQTGKVGIDSSLLPESKSTLSGISLYASQSQAAEATQCNEAHKQWHPCSRSSGGWEDNLGQGNIVCTENVVNSSICNNSAVTASLIAVEALETADQTATSPSRGSGNSTDKSGKEAGTTSKRKSTVGDDSEYQSEDVEDSAVDDKKPSSGAKRSRAAEMHNQSERRRRDRINEKMKALQDLIPNSNKTDKASVLDEAIEYLKLLQSQLQALCMRTGAGIPPSIMPSIGMQHMQMPALSSMGLGVGVGMGLGLGMGMGMGLMDANAAATMGHTMAQMPPLSGPTPATHLTPMGLQACNPPLTRAQGPDELHSSNISNPYNIYLPQQQAQPASLNLNMHRNLDMYNAYMMQQQQQLQQQLMQSRQSQGNDGSKPNQ